MANINFRKYKTDHLGAVIKELRKITSMNQAEFASILCIDQTALSRVENSIQKVSVEQVVCMMNYFNLASDDIFTNNIDYQKLEVTFQNKPR